MHDYVLYFVSRVYGFMSALLVRISRVYFSVHKLLFAVSIKWFFFNTFHIRWNYLLVVLGYGNILLGLIMFALRTTDDHEK